VPLSWPYEKCQLLYPLTKLSRVDGGKGMLGIGIPVDIHVPWTPEFFERDLDLEKALEVLAN